MERRQFLSIAAAAPLLTTLDTTRSRMDSGLRRMLPAADVDHWWDVAAMHAGTYGRTAPGALLERLAPDLDEIAHLTERYPHQSDLHLIASRLCGLTGALHTDLGQDRFAGAWLHTASRYAQMSGDSAQRYWVAMAQAISALYGPAPQQAIRIADKARAQIGEAAVSAPAAQLAGLSARAHAKLGQSREARQELNHAQGLFERVTTQQANAEFFGFPSAEMDMYAEQVLTAIDDPDAWGAQTRALAAYPDDDPMDRPLILLDRARHLLRQGETDQAAKTAGDAITALPAPLRVPLLMAQARAVGDKIQLSSPAAAREYWVRITAGSV